MSYGPATMNYLNLAQEWRQRAKVCADLEERKVFLTIAVGYEQLASLSKNSGGAGKPVGQTV